MNPELERKVELFRHLWKFMEPVHKDMISNFIRTALTEAFENGYDKGRVDGQTKTPTYNDGLKDGFKQGEKAGIELGRKDIDKLPTGFLRQWINEDVKRPEHKLVTDEDIKSFIRIGL